ncbi:endonuclease G, mitochondrial-like [Varroa jacobsoni]|uniref:endonuclease G, mitochondrial-like n=1 Tax=Varroa jacobsoni TaxID=62625 RepID=UPI000BF926A9|nr:endonuclease G, mitochondrial-like [Varroa jacobsoni]XP_022700481.1 endonuclease G, mitochondrial-like [Varroa jacobsoni]XP_022700482.1 endonuclease G, mitochondrial-like [Varroa jacobsoni]XP_022700483.1 endonuclease G, mitochondrial-like [Varroa jacobsoni]XP_022700484.1 endonuclease G, mitochondrial-like [Varroa jacobsoni]
MLKRLRVPMMAGLAGAAIGAAATEVLRQNNGVLVRVKAADPLPQTYSPQLETTQRITEVMRLGFPGTDNIRYLSDYVLSYDKRNRTANWVMEHLTKENLRSIEEVSRTKCEFHEDQAIHPYFRSGVADYARSGFDRGHLAAAGNHRRTQKDMNDTFFYSNMAPQVGKGFNRDSWERLESHVRQLTRKYTSVYVCTGPLYLPRCEADGKLYVHYQVIGANHVAVPTHFFKVVVGETDNGEMDMEAYVMPNEVIDDTTPLEAFMVPLDTIERASGLLIFNRIGSLRTMNGKAAPKLLRPRM